MKNTFLRLHRWTEESPPLTRRQFFGAFSLLFALITVAFVGEKLLIDRSEHNRREARVVICQELNKVKQGTRTALAKQVSDYRRFLRKNPHGIPGIPPSLIRHGIKRLNDEITSNADVDCVAFVRNPSEITHKGSAAGG